MSKHRSTTKKAASKPKSKKHRSPKQIAAAKKNLVKARAARARKHRSTTKKAASEPKSKKHRSPKQIAAAKKNLAKARAARARKHRKYGRPAGWTAMSRWQRKAARAKQRAGRGPRITGGGSRWKHRMSAKAGTIAQTSYLAGLRARLAAQKAAAAGRAPIPMPVVYGPEPAPPGWGVAPAVYGRGRSPKRRRAA